MKDKRRKTKQCFCVQISFDSWVFTFFYRFETFISMRGKHLKKKAYESLQTWGSFECAVFTDLRPCTTKHIPKGTNECVKTKDGQIFPDSRFYVRVRVRFWRSQSRSAVFFNPDSESDSECCFFYPDSESEFDFFYPDWESESECCFFYPDFCQSFVGVLTDFWLGFSLQIPLISGYQRKKLFI